MTHNAISIKMGYGSCLAMTNMASMIIIRRMDPSKFTVQSMIDRHGLFIHKKEGEKTNITVSDWDRSRESTTQVHVDGSKLYVKCDIQVWVPRSIIPSRSEVKSLGDKGSVWFFSWWLETQCWYPKRKSPQP